MCKEPPPEIFGRRFCFCVFVFLQPAFQPVTNVSKDLFAVQFHQQLMPGTGVQLDLDVLHTGIQQALDRPLHTCALFAHRVGIACQEQQGQILGHPSQKSRVVQPQPSSPLLYPKNESLATSLLR